eukprot:COSAG06_NODE_1312_length_9891_cov_69.100082_15_plen_116_part_00
MVVLCHVFFCDVESLRVISEVNVVGSDLNLCNADPQPQQCSEVLLAANRRGKTLHSPRRLPVIEVDRTRLCAAERRLRFRAWRAAARRAVSCAEPAVVRRTSCRLQRRFDGHSGG